MTTYSLTTSKSKYAMFVFIVASVLLFLSGNILQGSPLSKVKSGDWTDTRKAPYLIYNGNADQMEVHWQLTSTKTCTIEWGTDTSYSAGSANTNEYNLSHQHKYIIDNLTPRTKYYYKVTAGRDVHYGSFYSAPDTAATQLKFFAYGDTRSNPVAHNKVAQGILNAIQSDPEFQTLVLSVGDLVSDGEDEYYWDDEFFSGSYSNINKMLANLPYQSARGNHEGNAILYKKYFPYPYVNSCYWSFDYGPAHFVVIDQYVSYSSGSAQYNWIDNDLATSTKPWKFILLHEPGWTAGGHSNEIPVQTYIQPLCETYHVPIIFGGHNHYYARAVVNDVTHITTGGGGAPLYDPNPNYPHIVVTAKAHHYCKIVLDDNMLYFSAYDDKGALIDTFSVERTPDGVISDNETKPLKFYLKQNYPNPFNPTTNITYVIARSEATRLRHGQSAALPVQLKVYDTLGREVTTLVNERQAPGKYSVQFNAVNLPSGIYFYTLRAGNFIQTRKMVLMK